MDRIIGIDYGDKRIGVSISDALGVTAQALETINWDGKIFAQPILRIKEIVNNYNVNTIVLGFPKNMNGSIGPRGELTFEFKKLLEKELSNITVILWDERLSSVSAKRVMSELKIKKKKKKKIIDQIAAVYILQNYLDSI